MSSSHIPNVVARVALAKLEETLHAGGTLRTTFDLRFRPADWPPTVEQYAELMQDSALPVFERIGGGTN